MYVIVYNVCIRYEREGEGEDGHEEHAGGYTDLQTHDHDGPRSPLALLMRCCSA